MGKRNRQRRAEKRRKRVSASAGGRFRGGDGWAGGWAGPSLDDLLDAGAECSWHGDEAGRDRSLGLLVAAATSPSGRTELSCALAGRLQRAVRRCWARGWQPADLARAVARQLGAGHQRLCVDAVALEARSYLGPGVAADPAWLDQLEELEATLAPSGDAEVLERWLRHHDLATVVLLALELLGLLEHAPALPRLCPPPSEWGTARAGDGGRAGGQADGKLLARVRALLAKAESTDFPEEAELLSAKAQELMARHAIDRAALLADGRGTDRVAGRRIHVDDPYAPAKGLLLSAVADANRCRSVWGADLGFSTVFGAPEDLEMVELLFTSLLAQATAAMLRAGADARHRRLPSFRQSFLVAYAGRIGERLRSAVEAEVDAGVQRHGDRLLPVLARLSGEVDDAVAATFPDLGSHQLAVNNWAGWAAGRVAADLADLAVGEALTASA